PAARGPPRPRRHARRVAGGAATGRGRAAPQGRAAAGRRLRHSARLRHHLSHHLTFGRSVKILKSVPQHPSADAVFDALGDGTRRAILERLTLGPASADRKSTRLNSSHVKISYAVFCLKKKKKNQR